MTNNINKYREELKQYNLTIQKPDEHSKYLQERLNSEILRVRLYWCKRDNVKIKRELIDTIKFILNDSNDSLGVRKVKDLYSDVDITFALLMQKLIKKLKHCKINGGIGIPEDIYIKHDNEQDAVKEWYDILDKISYAFQLISTKNYLCLTDEEKIQRKDGLRLFIQYNNSLFY
jgi:hypothetical protein